MVAFLNRRRPSRFSGDFAWSWGIEGGRAAIGVSWIHQIGDARVWFALRDAFRIPAHWLLFSTLVNDGRVDLPHGLPRIYFGASLSFVLIGRFLIASLLAMVCIAVLDDSGIIPAANRAWLELAAAHGADEDEVSEGRHFRIAREALTNVVQQARAGNVRVELARGGRVAAGGRR